MATVRDVSRQFNPLEPLPANDLRYVDCTKERGIPALFAELQQPLDDPPPKSLLFTGHMGDGKTTILRQLQGQLEAEGYFVAFGEADDYLDLSKAEYDDVLLAVLAVVDRALRERYRQDAEAGPFQQLWQELSRIANQTVELKGEAEVALGPFVKLTATVKDAPDVRQQVRQKLRQATGPTFLGVINEYVERAQAVVRAHGHNRLVVILDNLDRIDDPQLDAQLFLGHATQLLEVRCHVIYTIRLALAHAQASNLRVRYGQRPAVVPMIPVRQRDGTPNPQGMAKLQEVIERRLKVAGTGIAEAFQGSALDELCHASGGHLRELMMLVRSACAAAQTARRDLPLTEADGEAAIRQLRADRRSEAADYYEVLRQVAETKNLGGLPLDVQQTLLRHFLVYEYRDAEGYWYDAAPMAL